MYLAVFALVAVETVRLAVDGRVLAAGQRRVAQPAAKVVRVPRGVLGRCVLAGEDQLRPAGHGTQTTLSQSAR